MLQVVEQTEAHDQIERAHDAWVKFVDAMHLRMSELGSESLCTHLEALYTFGVEVQRDHFGRSPALGLK